MLRNDEMAVKAHRRYLEQKRQFDRDVDKFRLTCQIPEIQRDFDLNNPNRLKYEGPPREGDYDSLIGPSSLQKYMECESFK